MKILDPEFLGKYWNKIVLVSCIMTLWLDSLLFFVPWVNPQKLNLSMDKKVAFGFCGARSLFDIFYVFHIYRRFRTGFGSDKHVEDSKEDIRKRYLQSYFMIDILSILPLPQVVTAIVIPNVTGAVQIRQLMILTMAQNFIRFVRMAPLLKEVSVMSGTAWSGAATNLLLYTIASHVTGSIWYLGSLERTYKCWRAACRGYSSCNLGGLFSGGDHHGSNSFLISSCLTDDAVFLDYGIYLDARSLQLSRYFRNRYFHCFVWGLRNLSSLGQNLETSSGIKENIFVVIISITGLILFSFLATNIQRFVQSLTAREDNMRVKIRDREQWMARTKLPQKLRSRVRRHDQRIWETTRGVDEESLISDLPADLRRDIKHHQCQLLLLNVPMFKDMDSLLQEALCCCLKHVFYTSDTIIVRKGDPVVEILFIMRGKIVATTTNGGRTRPFTAEPFCGEELLTRALDPNSSSSLPISPRMVQAKSDVEAFCLKPEDLKPEDFKSVLRFYSRTRAACFIQAVWRWHWRRKVEREMKAVEDGRLHGAILHHVPSIADVVYGSILELSTLLPEKPSETNLGAEDDPLLRVGEGVSDLTNDFTA